MVSKHVNSLLSHKDMDPNTISHKMSFFFFQKGSVQIEQVGFSLTVKLLANGKPDWSTLCEAY